MRELAVKIFLAPIHHQHKFHKDNLQLMWKNRLVMEVREVKTAAERERGMEEVNL